MKILFIIATWLVAMAIGGWVGVQTGYKTVRNVADIDASFEVASRGWSFSETVGSPASSAVERARIALGGPLALSSDETIYFLTTSDDSGKAFNSSCTYVVSGRAFDARWWSLAIYDGETHEYIKNEDNRSSWNSEALIRDEDGFWTFTIAPNRIEGTPWLASQVEPGKPFELLLRLYNPSAATRAAAPAINLPTVERVSC